ncbi:anti-phage deoxyguanosine triphosphatase [Psittacicella hinzii]|uniref:HD domain-containing protein n=1 Tax=Psittacicella hinzii TaxID=2028575 RepID=A0A3A1YDE0_9GAMM|nr:anti-phage deoxyguanosine triphosphatase [Psittacicella hinzii]RIY35695.1 hypothetical protein CKF58_06555 [Psittacicella hinzii]
MIQSFWQERRSNKNYLETEDKYYVRSNYERDKARVIHSNSFRRLQAKTQLFNVVDSDISHTRLTHSLEVAQVGTGIVRLLKAKYDPEFREYYETQTLLGDCAYQRADKEQRKFITSYLPPEALIETICLTHDIGHSPFGHSGEYAMNSCMFQCGGFESNAQTFRLLTHLDNYSPLYGLDLTRRTLLGVVKYPHVFTDNSSTEENVTLAKNLALQPIKGIYLDDQEAFDWLLQPLSESDRKNFVKVSTVGDRPKTLYHSFDCSIMELADDITYVVHDVEDAIILRYITRDDWEEFYEQFSPQVKQILQNLVTSGYLDPDYVSQMFGRDAYKRRKVFSALVHLFIIHVDVRPRGVFAEPLLDLQAFLPEDLVVLCKFLKEFSNISIYSQDIRGVNNKGCNMMLAVFNTIASRPYVLGSAHAKTIESLTTQRAKYRYICDYIACMTNEQLQTFYNKYI